MFDTPFFINAVFRLGGWIARSHPAIPIPIQRFDATGQFQCMYLIREQRVIDSVSGAMAAYEDAEEEDD